MASHYNIKNPSQYLTEELFKLKSTFANNISKNDILTAQNTFNEFNKICTDHFVRAIWAYETSHFTLLTARSISRKGARSIPLTLESFIFARDILTKIYYEPNMITYFNTLQERHNLKPKPLENIPTNFTI